MNLSKEKKEALLIIGLAILLHAYAWHLLKNTYGYETSQTLEGPGLLVSPIGLFFWLYGFLKYARAKGRSELLALFLSLFWLPGLFFLLILTDVKKTRKS